MCSLNVSYSIDSLLDDGGDCEASTIDCSNESISRNAARMFCGTASEPTQVSDVTQISFSFFFSRTSSFLSFFFSFVKYLKDKLTNCVWRGGEGKGGRGQDFSAKFHRCAAAAAAVREIGRSRWILSEIIRGE